MGSYMWDTDTYTHPLQGESELKPQETSQLNVLVVSDMSSRCLDLGPKLADAVGRAGATE